MNKKAIIIGAGPAGLTAAYELITRTNIVPVILEKSTDIGGLSRTINYKGNRMDIGGHRFFSKSDRVMNWWLNILPIEENHENKSVINYHNRSYEVNGEQLHRPIIDESKVMLLRNRLSRIYHNRQFFNYPISLSLETLKKLGLAKTIRIAASYTKASLFPRKEEKSLEDFFINRFGEELYKTFFKGYTEKVWGLPCDKISAEWGRQRIKQLSVFKTIQHALKKRLSLFSNTTISQKKTETSLIEKFLYPRLGPGQLWEEVAAFIVAHGGEIHYNQDVIKAEHKDNIITKITAVDRTQNTQTTYEGDYFFSTMPIKELVESMSPSIPEDVRNIASSLQYRDFVTIGLLVKNLAINEGGNYQIKDNWIYIQDDEVKIGRLQIFNNWSPAMVNREGDIWLGLEYFCNVGDALWNLSDKAFIEFAMHELEQIQFIRKDAVIDSHLVRVEKAYPVYFGSYDQFPEVRSYLDGFQNLYLLGRNGMHKYNNSDHSMLTAMVAVDNIIAGIASKENIWAVNTEEDYHEEHS